MTDLDYHQRKALRRLGRGLSVARRMYDDPIISRCIVNDAPEPPTGDDLNVVSWCDWAEDIRNWARHPRLTEYGRELLAELDGATDD